MHPLNHVSDTQQAHSLAQGQTWQLAMTQGSELFCLQGQIVLNTAALPLLDGGMLLTQPLLCGQSWRAPADLLLTLSAPHAAGRVQLTLAPATAPRMEALPAHSSLWMRLCRWLAPKAGQSSAQPLG